MTTENATQFLASIAEQNPDAILADGFENAIIGTCHRFGQEPVVAYDYEKCIEILMKDLSREAAEEYFQFNIIGAWVGEYTPVFIYKS
jgi:hypothetical protein